NVLFCFFSSRRRHTRSKRDWSSDVCSSDLLDEGCKVVDGLDLLVIINGAGVDNLEVTRDRDVVDPDLGASRVEANRSVIVQIARSEERRVGKESRYSRWPVEGMKIRRDDAS